MAFLWSNSANWGSATSATVAKGANTITQGDLLIAIVNVGNSTTATVSPPDGSWTVFTGSNVSNTQFLSSGFYKVAGASESGSYVFTMATSAGTWMLLDYGAMVVDAYTATTDAGFTTHTLPSVTPGAGNTTDIWVGIGAMVGNSGTHTMTGPTTFRASIFSGSSATFCDTLVQDITLSSASATGTGTYTQSTSGNPASGYSLALKASSYTATPLSAGAPVLGTPALGIYSALNLGNNVLDFGLNRLHTNANWIYVCSTVPTTYVQATTTYALGSASVAAGTLFGTMSNGSPAGRIVNSSVINAGAVSSNGTPVCWAVIDSVNSDLMATGPATGFTAVTSGQTWQLGSFDVHMSNT